MIRTPLSYRWHRAKARAALAGIEMSACPNNEGLASYIGTVESWTERQGGPSAGPYAVLLDFQKGELVRAVCTCPDNVKMREQAILTPGNPGVPRMPKHPEVVPCWHILAASIWVEATLVCTEPIDKDEPDIRVPCFTVGEYVALLGA